MQRFALLDCSAGGNIGDNIQGIAAARFLPRIDALADRERLDRFEAPDPHRIILNGWFMHQPEHWPPSPSLDALVASFHISRSVYPALNRLGVSPDRWLLSGAGLEWLRGRERVGARDVATLELLEAAGIEAWLSGCLTLTLDRADVVDDVMAPRSGLCLVDVSNGIAAHVRALRGEQGERIAHIRHDLDRAGREAQALRLLRRYASAALVVTGRLHCALPCVALGTPVLLIRHADDWAHRFAGLEDTVHMASEWELITGTAEYDVKAPPENPGGWRERADRLADEVKAFVARG